MKAMGMRSIKKSPTIQTGAIESRSDLVGHPGTSGFLLETLVSDEFAPISTAEYVTLSCFFSDPGKRIGKPIIAERMRTSKGIE
jgi:hypothetical protein